MKRAKELNDKYEAELDDIPENLDQWAQWTNSSWAEISLGLELAYHIVSHIDAVITPEDGREAVTPLLEEHLRQEGYEPYATLTGRVIEELQSNWDMYDPWDWERALNSVRGKGSSGGSRLRRKTAPSRTGNFREHSNGEDTRK